MHQLLSKQPRLIIKSAYLIQIVDPSLQRQGLFFLRFGDGLKLFLYVREGSGSFRLLGLDNVADRNTIIDVAVNVL